KVGERGKWVLFEEDQGLEALVNEPSEQGDGAQAK
ncbi:MAG: hypothetical protein ACI81V_001321, partial [Lentimonas sp.]